MRCSAVCTSTSYDIKPLLDYLQGPYHAILYRDAIHVSLRNGDHIDAIADIFYFSYGVMVSWGLSREEEHSFLEKVKSFEHQPLEVLETDEFTFSFGEAAKVHKDEITLPNKEVMTRLAFSHGLAQSVKLSTFESAIQKTFNSTKHIPEDLAKHGRIPLSRREIRRKMGELFIERNSINLHFDVLDTPEFFWEHSELEPFYMMIANYLDLQSRVEVLNQRLDVVHELFNMLGNELNHQHSSRLEWAIIWLIVIEVLVSLFRDVFQII